MAIGETILSAVLQVVFDRLASKEVTSLFKSSKVDQSVVDKLKYSMLEADKLLADAEQKQFTDVTVKSWLTELKHLFYRAEELADEIATEALRSSVDLSPEPKSFWAKGRMLIPAFGSSSSFAVNVSSEISKVATQLDLMVSRSVALNLREGSANVNMASRRATSSYFQQDDKVFGRDQEKEELFKFLFPEEAERNRIGVVAIVGMGGMGKTTLAKFAYNDARLDSFDLKVWVYVSDQFDISRVIKSILESITGQSYSGSFELEFLHRELSGKLNGKRFFLVLDDVWNENPEEWERLWAPLTVGTHGSKIIVTTRKEKVAFIVHTISVIRLKPLSDDEGWSLFSKHAFATENLHSNPHIESIGRNIVSKCRGLPLAIKTLGGLLWSKEGINEWEMILNSTLWDLLDGNTDVAPALRLSYHYLPSQLKRCFSYCAIFPKGYRFDPNKLVLLWMAENFVKSGDSGQRPEDKGEEYLKQLVSCSFFERLGNHVIMHDLMHDLAEVVSGEFFARLEHGDEASRICEKARYFSFFQDEFDTSSKFEGLVKAEYIRAFVRLEESIIRGVSRLYLTNGILQFHCLHVLSLSKYEVLELPKSIGNLKHLRYLDVSRTQIKELPESVSTLCNLQSLLLSGCDRLERLPAELSRLVSLRHLDISGTVSLRQMPKHMSKLECLQSLGGFVVGKHHGQGIEELWDLRNIRGKLALRSLQNISSLDGALDANLNDRKYIYELAYEYDDGDIDDSETVRAVLENLRPHQNLKQLTIRKYPGTRFPSWLETQCSVFENIVNLSLSDCKNCCLLPSLGQLPSLKFLDISSMDSIERIRHEFYGYDSGDMNPFPVLLKLTLCDMKTWKEWSEHDMEGRVCFPRLEELCLIDCPELKGVLPANVWSGRSLKVLEIRGCESLDLSMPQQASIQGSAFHHSSITRLELSGLKQLVSLPAEVGSLSCLDSLVLESCDNLKSLKNVTLQPSLRSLRICNCKMLESLPTDMNALNNLQDFYLFGCPSFKSGGEDSLPTSLQDVDVQHCERWELPIPVDRMECYSALKFLCIADIGGSSFPIGAFPNLKQLYLLELKELERVYIPVAGVDHLANLTSLQVLYVSNCPKLKWVGKTEEEGVVDLPAPNLQLLEITRCDMLKPLMMGDREGLPSQLQTLWIDLPSVVSTLPSPSRRDLLMFSCLKELRIWGHQLAECFPQKGVSLPLSITVLELIAFPNLKYLNGEALKALTSLQRLDIWMCPKLECLPEEGLPASLRGLRIGGCPILGKRCQRDTGLDWPKIRHLPHIDV